MLLIGDLEAYGINIMQAIPEIKVNYTAITKDELMKFMQDHTEEQNVLLLTLAPHHDLSGSADSSRWENITGFYFLEKTDYSQHDHDGFLSIFKRTQIIAKKFVDKLLEDKADNSGLFCGFMAYLEESSISASPIKAINGCNGYYVEISMKSNL